VTPSHRTYLAELVESLRTFPTIFKDPFREVEPYVEAALTLAMLDLGPAREVLAACYAKRKGGKKPKDPVAMLRCIALMGSLGEARINSWVDRLDAEPLLAILSGFSPRKRPGVGTFYDFFARLLDGTWRKRCEHDRRPSDSFRGKNGCFRRNLKSEKEQTKASTQAELALEHETPTQNAVRKALSALDQAIPEDALRRVEELLFRCAVVPSAELDLLGDLSAIDVAGDGSALESHANGDGRALCTCRKEGKGKCECDRSYSDPEARWGYDCYHERFFFGYRLHALVAKHGEVELPLHLMVESANTPDVLMGIEALSRLSKLLGLHLPGAKLDHGIFDAGYDAIAFHRLVLALSARPVIALNERNFKPQDDHGQKRDERGVPLCRGGVPMRFHCYNKEKKTSVFYCPAKPPGRTDGKSCFKVKLDRCPLGVLCDPESKMGPLVSLRAEEDPRLNPCVPRGSEEWKEIYNQRTCTERFNSFVKEAGGLGDAPYRRQHLFLFVMLGQALRRHAMEWVKARFGKKRPKGKEELLAVLEGLLTEESPKAAAA
jgi:hypothetical protein